MMVLDTSMAKIYGGQARRWARAWKVWAKRYRNRYDAQYAADGEYQADLHSCITYLKRALKEIAGENRPAYWCFVCNKWTDAKYGSYHTWCPTCKQDLFESNAEQRYETIASEALKSTKQHEKNQHQSYPSRPS